MMTTNRTLTLKTDKTTGSFVNDLLITAFSGAESISQLFEHNITALCGNDDLDIESFLGTGISVRLSNDDDSGLRYFHGLVSNISATGWQGRHAGYQLTLKPWLWLLQKTTDCRIFQQLSTPDIISRIFDENGFPDYSLRLSGNYQPRQYCVQYRESDFNFISRLLEDEGIYYYFTHEENKHTLILADSPGSHDRITENGTIPFYPPGSTVRHLEYLDQWLYTLQVSSASYALNDFDFTKPKAGLGVSQSITKEHDHNRFEIYDYPGSYHERNQGTQTAAIRIEEIHAQSGTSSGSGNVCEFYAGGLFELVNHPQEKRNKSYLITACRYQATINDYNSGGHNETIFSSQIDCIDSDTQYRPISLTPQPVIPGPQTGIIVGPEDEDIWTDEYGRVKVQFHWDRYGESNENSSCWIRVSQLWAGSNWGGIHIPRIGQEVIIEFLEGNPDMPIITGRTYNADNMPPYNLPDNQTQSGIKSRSSNDGSHQNYNEICFEDLAGSELLTLHAEKDQLIEVENDEAHTVGNDRSMDIGHNHAITIGNDRNESIKHDDTLSVANNRHHSIDNNENITIGSSRSMDIGENETRTIGSNRQSTIGKDDKLIIDAGRSTRIAQDDVLDVGKNLVIQAGDQITFKTGSAQIMMKKNGDIILKGKNIQIKGSGNVIIKGSKVQSN